MSVEERPRPSTPIGEGEAEGEASPGTPPIVLSVLFALYLVLLTWIVLWKLEVPYLGAGELRQVKLVPFVSSACNGASAPSEVIANVVLFIPFGLYLGLLAPAWPWWRTAVTIAGASLGLEIAQYVLAVGSSDLTDVITNTVGCLVGLGLLMVVRRRLGTRTLAVMTRVCSLVTVLALLLTAAVVASPVRFAPPRDVGLSAHGALGAPGAEPGELTGDRDRLDRLREPCG
ncbi:glycopeptide antibiotics resistance protein [Agromyces hippuratus]|uniref:Glycopeptide antibiotics resistance protein n=1 Tax=Agromyces hippuratus TaxID=286438 RepID=A0A852WQ09_9MICO|nr:VanZ family protein [Agromyces hippuratus]NYG19638.1 glycopeptide antibiotics resistance protein [Agromyces hippuratus]